MISEYGRTSVRTRKTLRKVLLALIAVLVALIVVRVVAGSGPLTPFPVVRIQIFGTGYLDKREVLARAGLEPHTSILSFNKRLAKRSLLGDPRVSGVEIVKLFPDTVRIYVVEKEKKTILRLVDGDARGAETGSGRGGESPSRARAYWLSRDGVVLAPVSAAESSGVGRPSVTLVSNTVDIQVGGRTGDYLLESVLEALGGIESLYPGFFRRVENVSIERDGVRVRLDDERYSIYFGETASVEKFEQLRALLLVLESRNTAGGGADTSGGGAEAGSIGIDMSSSQAAIAHKGVRP